MLKYIFSKGRNFFIMEKNLSIGETRVRTEFNPSKLDVVEQIKQKTAELINIVEELKSLDPRLGALAQTDYENAAMWAVKLATTKPK